VTARVSKILIVDDTPHNIDVLSATLADEHCELMAATSGARALELAARGRPDLVLLDVMMPKVDGWEMLQRMHERHGVGSIPVVMFSGKVDESAAGQAAEHGAQGFIGKPFDPHELIAQTKQLLPT